MKVGKFIPLGEYNNVKIGYGTVDFKNLKTIYLKFNSWLEPESDDVDFNYLISISRKRIKKRISELKNIKFKSQSIVDLDIKTNGIKLKKRSFMNLEITLFINEFFDVKSKTIKSEIKNLMLDIINNDLTDISSKETIIVNSYGVCGSVGLSGTSGINGVNNSKMLYNFHNTKK